MCVDIATNLLNAVNDKSQIKYKDFIDYYNDLLVRYNTYHYFLNRWKPFCQEKIYENFFQIDIQIKSLVDYIGKRIQEDITTDNVCNLLLKISNEDAIRIEYKENVVESSLEYKFFTIEVLEPLDKEMISLDNEMETMINKLPELQDDISKNIRENDKIYK